MSKNISRREFLKLGAINAAGFASLWAFGKNVFGDTLVDTESTVSTVADTSSNAIIRDISKCIGCGQCVDVCKNTQAINILELKTENGKTYSDTIGGYDLSQTKCIGCGQCSKVCPTGAIAENDALQKVTTALNSGKKIVWQFAPSSQNILGEEFGLLSGENVSGKIATSAKMLGDYVFRTDFGADITIMEEVTELITRIKTGGVLPMITSCCPGWINYAELNYPSLFDNISSCKSPQQMLGALIKNYLGKDNIYHIAVMPCTAKKHEALRPEMYTEGGRDVDAVLTVREYAKLLRSKGINLAKLQDSEYDSLFGNTSGAGRIFGASGGVTEAAIRSMYELMTGEILTDVEFKQLRGSDGIKHTEIKIKDQTIKACVVNGIKNAEKVLDEVKNGTSPYTFIEIMACPGGCVGGGGTPLYSGNTTLRSKGLYESDRSNKIRKCHENSSLKAIYEKYLTLPCSNTAHKYLHTYYTKR